MMKQERFGPLDTTLICASSKPKAICVLCHGFGAPGNDLVPIGQQLLSHEPRLSDVAFVFPKAPIELDPFFESRAWWMIDIEKILTNERQLKALASLHLD